MRTVDRVASEAHVEVIQKYRIDRVKRIAAVHYNTPQNCRPMVRLSYILTCHVYVLKPGFLIEATS